ncbi:hypothetical protein C1645_808122, partial [Glomus cerebriforme]
MFFFETFFQTSGWWGNKNLKSFICCLVINLLFYCCFFVSSEDIAYTYVEPIENLVFLDTVANSDGTMMVWMVAENKTFSSDESNTCILPEFHLRLIDKIGKITYIDLHYPFPTQAICPEQMEFFPLTFNYILITFLKSTNDNGIGQKYGLLINYNGEPISEIFLGNYVGTTTRSLVPEKGFVHIEKPNQEGVVMWKWFSAPDAITGQVAQIGSGEFDTRIGLTNYSLITSTPFNLIDGGIGYLFILRYDGNEELTKLTDPNFQFWRIYVSFLKDGTDTPSIPSLVYQTTKNLNNIEVKSPCSTLYYGDGYVCILSLNNTIKGKKKIYTEINHYQLGFLSTGAFVRLDRLDIIPKNASDFIVSSLFYGGFAVQNFYDNTNANDGYILDDSGKFVQDWGSFGPDFVHTTKYRRNNTIYGITAQQGQKFDVLLKSLLRLNNNGLEYENPIIQSTKPAIGEVIDSSIEEIIVVYNIPVRLSSANVSIFQKSGEKYEPDLLRQTISGDSRLCFVGNDNFTVHIPVFGSTFSQSNASYYITIDNDFVMSQKINEPLIGIPENIWMFSTDPSFKKEQHSDSVTGALRLNEEGSSIFLQTDNQSGFIKNLFQELSNIIPVNNQRLTSNGRWQYDPTAPKKVLLSFNINEAKDDATEQSSLTIYDHLNTLIAQKDYTALSNSNYTYFIDDSRMTQNYFEKFFPLFMIYIICVIILIILYAIARQKNSGGKNFAIFGTAFLIQDFVVDLLFTLLYVKNVPFLIIPNMIFFVIPIIFNCIMALNIFIIEITQSQSFVAWFVQYPALSSIFTLLAAVDIQVLETLSSGLFGLKIFSAPITPRSKKYMLWVSIANVFIEDVPQLIIQILYYQHVVTYDINPSIGLITNGLIITNKLLLRSYDALVRCHKHNKIRNSRHISVDSIKSLKSNIESSNEKKIEEEEEKDLTDNASFESNSGDRHISYNSSTG